MAEKRMVQRSVFKLAAVLGACVAALTFGILPAERGGAEELYREFVRRLQENGYADVAIEYLRMLEKRPDLPEEIRESLDYEIAKTLVVQTEDADLETERKLLEESAQLFSKFLAEHKDSDDANDALAELAGVFLKQGQQMLGRAESEKDTARRGPLRTDARKKFEEARDRLITAVGKFRTTLRGDASASTKNEGAEKSAPEVKEKTDPKSKTKSTTKSTATKKPRVPTKTVQKKLGKDPRLEGAFIVARLNLAMAEYFIGRTYDAAVEAEKKQKKTQLDNAIQTFDDLFQEYRGSFAGFYAHLWHGRALEEQGDLRQALMLYDEVLAPGNEPPPGQRLTREQAALFTQAELFRLSVLNRQGKQQEVIDEAEPWLRQHQDRRRTPHGLGLQLELVKALSARAMKLPAGSPDRRQAFARTLKILNDEIAKFRSPYQNEAFRMRQEYSSEIRSAEGKIASFDEGTFVGDAAMGGEKWAEAIAAYEQALQLYEQAPKPVKDKIDEDEVEAARYRLTFSYYKSGNMARAATIGEALAREKPKSKWGPDAAAIAMVAYSAAYGAAKTLPEKEAAITQLASLARHIEQKWPQHSQADVARRTVGSFLLYRRDFLTAAETYARITTGSPLYADAQAKVGQAYWSAYLAEVAKPEADRNTAAMPTWLDEARAALGRSIATQKAALKPDSPVPAGLVEAQLTQAEITLKHGTPAEATPLLEPLLPLVQAGDRKDLAPFAVRLLVAAMEAVIAQGDIAKAEALMSDLEKQGGGDTTRITQVLVALGRSLEQQLRQHQAAGRTKEAESVRSSYETFLEKLDGREQQTAASLQYLAESYFALGNHKRAAETFDRMLQKLTADRELAQKKEGKSEIQRVRLRRATSLRLVKDFQPALTEIDALLNENKNLLPAVMEKGRVLQDWGDQNTAKFGDAAKWWNEASKKLQTITPRPAEYFEARYGLAFCLSRLGKKGDAVTVLQSTMTLSPDCGGPELKGKYESLLKKLQPGGAAPTAKTAADTQATGSAPAKK